MLASRNFVLTLEHREVRRKLVQLQWEKGDHGLGYYVHLHYFAHETGLLGLYHLCGAAGTTKQQDLLEGGKTTRNKVKFSHHADGEAHFSGAGKIYTVVRQHTRPLSAYEGHAFTISSWNLLAFDEADESDNPKVTTRRSVVSLGRANEQLIAKNVAGDIVGFWFPHAQIKRRWLPRTDSEITQAVTWRWSGQEFTGTILRPPEQFGETGHVLGVAYRDRRDKPDEGRPALAFYGGFLDVGESTDPDSCVDYLSLKYGKYGDAEFKDYERRLGSVDIMQ